MKWVKEYIDNKHGKMMIEKLSGIFYKKFWLGIVVFTVSIIIMFTLLIVECIKSFGSNEDVLLPIIYLLILISLVIGAIIDTKPFFKDLKCMKSHEFQKITGEVIKYRRVVHGGDPDTINDYPTIRDINKEWVEIEVKANNTQLNKTYDCIYLPNTKLAVCEESANLNDSEIKV